MFKLFITLTLIKVNLLLNFKSLKSKPDVAFSTSSFIYNAHTIINELNNSSPNVRTNALNCRA